MANTIGSLLVALGLDISDFKSGLADAENEGKSAASRIGSGLAGIGGAAIVGIGAVATAAAGFLASTIGPASDLNETVSKVGVVFGGSSNAVLEFGKTAANSLGMSQNAALSAAGTYGNLFRAMGITEQSSADMSIGLVKLAGDLASFNNMDPTEVMDALRSGLSGETEPLKRLGININQAAIEAQALKSGLWDGIAPISAAAKAQATYALVMEQTTLAQGDFARTSDGVANQQRIMAANFEDIRAKIGTGLLPMLSALSTTLLALVNSPGFQAGLAWVTAKVAEFSDYVVANMPGVIEKFQNLMDWLNNNQGIIVAVLAVIGVAMVAFGVQAAIGGLTAMAGMWPLILTIGLIALAAYLLYLAWTNNWGDIQGKTAEVWAWLEPKLMALKAWFDTNLPIAMQALSDFWFKTLVPMWDNMKDWLTTNIPIAIAKLKLKWDELQIQLFIFKDYIDKHISPMFSALWQLLEVAGGNALKGLGAGWDALQPTLKVFLDLYLLIIKKEFGFLFDVMGKVGDFISRTLKKDFEGLTLIIDGVTDALRYLIGLFGITADIPGVDTSTWGSSVGGSSGLDYSNRDRVLPGSSGVNAIVPGGGGGLVVNYYDNAIVSSARESEIADKLGPAILAKMRQYGYGAR